MSLLDAPAPRIDVQDPSSVPYVYTWPYFAPVSLSETLGSAINDYLDMNLPIILPPYIDPAAQAAVAAIALLRAGDTATGPIYTTELLPTADAEFATKLYVDTVAAGIVTIPEAPPGGAVFGRNSTIGWLPVLPLTGGTLTGNLVVGSTSNLIVDGSTILHGLTTVNNAIVALQASINGPIFTQQITATAPSTFEQVSLNGVLYPNNVATASLPGAGAGAVMLASDAINPRTNTNTGPQLVSYIYDGSWRVVGSDQVAQTTPYTSIALAPGITSDNAGNLHTVGQLTSVATGGGPASAIFMQAANPSIGWWDTSQPVDGHIWDAISIAGALTFRALNDAQTAGNNWLSVTRLGDLPQQITLTAPSIVAAGALSVPNMPTSAAGLPPGTLWNNGGVVNVAP